MNSLPRKPNMYGLSVGLSVGRFVGDRVVGDGVGGAVVGEAEGGGVGGLRAEAQLDISNTGLFVGGGVGLITPQPDKSITFGGGEGGEVGSFVDGGLVGCIV